MLTSVGITQCSPLAAALDFYSWRSSYLELRSRKEPEESTWDEIIGSKDPTTFTVFLEDSAGLRFFCRNFFPSFSPPREANCDCVLLTRYFLTAASALELAFFRAFIAVSTLFPAAFEYLRSTDSCRTLSFATCPWLPSPSPLEPVVKCPHCVHLKRTF